MENEKYSNLKGSLKRSLNRFRSELLFSDLMRGGSVLLLFFVLYILFYYFIISLLQISVVFKTILYSVYVIAFILLFLSFILYPFIRFFLSLNLKKDILLKRFLKLSSFDNDIFISLYQLAFHAEKISGDQQLKEAAFIQKYDYLKAQKWDIAFPWKMMLRRILIFSLFLFLFLINGKSFRRLYTDMCAYEEVQNPKFDIDFDLQNKSLKVEYGKPIELKLEIRSEYLAVGNVFICFGGGEFLMDKNDSLFVYTFDVVNNDIKFHFKTSGVESKSFEINVLPTPEITDYQVTYIPPKYTELKQEVLKNVVDFRVVYGSTLRFDLSFSELDTLYLYSENTRSLISLKSDSKTVFSREIRSSGEYSLYGSNKNFVRKNLINFSVTCIPDLYPGIQITEIQDSVKSSLFYFYGVISDDYGFSDLRFNYSTGSSSSTVMPINVVKSTNAQEFYFSFDFAEFAGMDKAKVDYFFEVFDNDMVSGPKSTRSDVQNYLVPDLNTIFDYNLQVDNNVNSSLKEAEKLAQEIVSGVKDLQKKLLDNTIDNWEKQQMSKDIVEKKEKLDKLLNVVKEDNFKKSSLNKSFTKQDSLLLEKQDRIRELMDKIMDDEMKKLMDEFAKLSQDFSKDKFQQLDEKMKLSFDQMSEELDRNIELLKRFQIEERHDMISKQLEKIKEDQQKFEKLSDNKSVSKDSLASMSEEIKDDINNLKNNLQDLLKNNQELSAPYDLKNKTEKLEDLSQNIDKQTENASQGKRDKKLSEDIKEKIDELSEEMEQEKQQNFNNMSLPESDIELIIQNILIISLSQEELLKEFSSVGAQSLRYNELGRLQDLKKQEYKIVKDSLSVLAKSNLMLASILSDKFYDIEIKFGLLPGYIQGNRRGDLLKEQQYIINYLNDIALSLTDALRKSKSQSQKGNSKGKNSGSKQEPGGKSSGEGYGGMKKLQQGMKQQLEDMVNRIKNGEKGKPLQQGISNMIRQNELFRKSLNDFLSENGSLSTGEKQLLNEINRLIEENIRDMANYSVSNQLINRNNQIYSKLLMSEKASKEREEYEEKRKSTTANDIQFNKPEAVFDFKKKSGLIKTDLRKSDIKLNPFFKNMYNNYYIKLGNE